MLKDNYIYFYIKNYSINEIVVSLKKENINVYEIKNNKYLKIKYNDYINFKKKYFYLDLIPISISGKKYYIYFLKKYYLAIIGLLLSMILVFLCSFLIVNVEVDSSDETIRKLILNELEKYEIKNFSFKKNYDDLQNIKEKIKEDNLDKIEWIEIENVGMKYIVHVEKRIINPEEEKDEYCHIYAKKDGLISKLKIYRGESNILINDYVKKDDLLISGDITKNGEVVDNVCASGKVYAQVWYIVNTKVPLDYVNKENTGKKRYNFIINYNGNDYQIFKNRLTNFRSSKKEILDFLGIRVYLKTDFELTNKEYRYSENDALKKAMDDSLKSINNILKDGERIVSQKVLQNKIIDSTMNVEVFIVTEEEIGILKKGKEVNDDI